MLLVISEINEHALVM